MALPDNALRFRPCGPDPERSARAWLMRIAYIKAACRRTRHGVPLGVTMRSIHGNEGAIDGEAVPMKDHPVALAAIAGSNGEDEVERHRLLGRIHDIIGDLPEIVQEFRVTAKPGTLATYTCTTRLVPGRIALSLLYANPLAPVFAL